MGGHQGDPGDAPGGIPVGPGTYVLVAELSEVERLRIGRLGTFDFEPGSYLYVGSALNGLRSRVGRHIRGGRTHWHIDYLLAHASLRGVWIFESPRRLECRIAEVLSRHLPRPIRGFGASDCRCPGHLFYVGSDDEDLAHVGEGVRAHHGGTVPFWWVQLDHEDTKGIK